ncbi:hypothetical protein Sya03_23520 [Spirilliplanes yamanashiensis]|uniref:DNA ligase (ATP) n=1 Tax=Spirilliplanes yamanashiensis TaxID=42233 RepID=A0A8J4DJH6_9ACTN|nr:hypothetical protein Sya03_23520 [Spirilliplanes yamanashiensis]
MLATAGPAPRGPGWAYEFKWDGVRAVVHLLGGRVQAFSRNDRDITASYPELAEVAALLAGHDAVLDGEIVALDAAGRPSFAQLQRRMHVHDPAASLVAQVPVRYYVFDLMHLDGEDLTGLPYRRRRELLDALGPAGDVVQVPEVFAGADPAAVTAAAAARGLEGVVAKRLDAVYRPGQRSPSWVKVPFSHHQEVVVAGWKPGTGRRAGTIGSLVLAVTGPDGTLSFAGGVGTGFTDAMLRDLQRQLGPLERRSAPLVVPREHARGVRWVEPVLVGEVAYRNWTPDGRLRHPSWRGLRPDRTPAEARRPEGGPAGDAVPPSASVAGAMQTRDGRWRVDIMHRGASRWYRLSHDDNTFDWLDLADVERILHGVDVDLGDLVDAPVAGGRLSA